MSYHKKQTGDSLNDWFSNIAEFMNIAPNLLKAPSERSFEVWFEKLEQIDKRTLILYLKEHKDEIPYKHLEMVRWRIPKRIWNENFKNKEEKER